MRPKSQVPQLTAQLATGVEGVSKLLKFALPYLDWSEYNATGGPTEGALTLELIVILNKVPNLSRRLFNPKLVDAGTPPIDLICF